MPAKKNEAKKAIKKVVKKKTVKKVPAKKKTAKVAKPKSKKLVNAPAEQYFILCNGKPLKNVKELAEVLEEIEDTVFNYHVTPDKNDFATWLTQVLNEVKLAKEIAGIKEKDKMRLVLYKHIVKKLA